MKKAILLTILVCFASIVLAQNSNVRNHTKLQNSVSYETRMKNNEAFTKKSAKRNWAAAKKKNRLDKADAKRREKILAIRQKTIQL